MLCWDLGHVGITENECANVLANKASAEKPIGPEPFCG